MLAKRIALCAAVIMQTKGLNEAKRVWCKEHWMRSQKAGLSPWVAPFNWAFLWGICLSFSLQPFRVDIIAPFPRLKNWNVK